MNTITLVRAGACAALVAVAGLFGAVSSEAQTRAPRFEVDANWPKPLPDQWVMGGLGGLCVDRNDHVFILRTARSERSDHPARPGRPEQRAPLITPSTRARKSWIVATAPR